MSSSGPGIGTGAGTPHGEPAGLGRARGAAGSTSTQADRWVEPREVDGALVGEATFDLPTDLPLGWHRHAAGRARAPEAFAQLVVTPDRMPAPSTGDRPAAWGLMTQLYSVRSRRSWGTATSTTWPS